MSGPSGGQATPVADGDGERPPMPVYGSQPPPRNRPDHRTRRLVTRSLVVPAGGVQRSAITSSRRQTSACAGGQRGRSARFGGGSPDSAGASRVLPRACADGCVGGSAPRWDPRVPDDRGCSHVAMNIHAPSASSPGRILLKILQSGNAPVGDLERRLRKARTQMKSGVEGIPSKHGPPARYTSARAEVTVF